MPTGPARVVPELADAADSLAWRAAQYAGPIENVPALGFRFAVEADGAVRAERSHFWDRQGGRYRVDWTQADTAWVAVFEPGTYAEQPGGKVFANGQALADSARTRAALDRGYRMFANDTYWLLAPAKLFDGGVNRALAPDSSDAQHEALQLTFGNVGLTPGDTYWLFIDRETGRLNGWSFILEGSDATTASRIGWADYQTQAIGQDTVRLSTAKLAGGRRILTDALRFPVRLRPVAFRRPGDWDAAVGRAALCLF